MPSPVSTQRSSKLDLVLILSFLAVIAAPAVDARIRPDSARGPEKCELRLASPRPVFENNWGGWIRYPDRFGKYFDDSFGLRDVLLRCHSLEKLFVFGVSATPAVVLGRDNWMFYAKEWSMEVFRGVHPFSESELERWRRMLESRRDFLKRCGIQYVFVIGPNKETIYPEYVPAAYNRVGPTRLDQLVRHLAEHSDFRIVDMRSALTAARVKDAPFDHVYFELGTHWNGHGIYDAARAIRAHLRTLFPAIKDLEPADVERRTSDDPGDTEAGWMYVADLFPQKLSLFQPVHGPFAQVRDAGWDRVHPRRLEVDDPALPSAILVHDSFGVGIEPLLGTCFRSSTWFQGIGLPVSTIEEEHPDVVIELYVERALVNQVPDGVIYPGTSAEKRR
jgi:hypothetical protein